MRHIMSRTSFSSVLIRLTWLLATSSLASAQNYTDALFKCILFFEGQRSGELPSSQRMTWRKNSALKDGSDVGMNLVGGYYDAGDNVKFNFPMAFTTTMLSWSVLEFGDQMGPELQHALEAIRWGADYLLKATDVADTVVGVVGDPNGDHSCSERPEDMDTPRTSYVVTKEKPGSELSGEIAAALAASSMVFKDSDKYYSAMLLNRSMQVFEFGDKYRGSYNDSIPAGACPFYCDISGYMDELIWGAAWLYKATGSADSYWNYVKTNINKMDSAVTRNFMGFPFLYENGACTEFGWDSKHAGINVLVSKWAMTDPASSAPFVPNANTFVCSILPESPSGKSVTYSPGGLMFKPGGSNLQHPTAISFLLIVYAGYLKAANQVVNCNNVVITPDRLVNFTKTQVDYILGNNPLGMSYMVGYGAKFPQKIHHRGSVLPSLDQHPQLIGCRGGDVYWGSQGPNLNMLTGAIVGGPAEDDTFQDSRNNVPQSEPTTYINAPFVGVLAYFRSLFP